MEDARPNLLRRRLSSAELAQGSFRWRQGILQPSRHKSLAPRRAVGRRSIVPAGEQPVAGANKRSKSTPNPVVSDLDRDNAPGLKRFDVRFEIARTIIDL